MARRRFLVEAVEEGSAELRGEDAHHLSRVLRAEAGQQYEISDGRQVYLAEIRDTEKNAVRFRILETLESPAPLKPLTLYMALIKFDRLEWAIEKATELGVTRIVPVECARSEAGLSAASVKRSERWRKIARESAQQSRRVSAPEVAAVQKVQGLRAAGLSCRMEEQGDCPFLTEVLRTGTGEVSLLVGPEGGWTDGERSALDQAGWLRAWLGPLVLRAETAAVAALAIAGQSG